MKSAKEAVGQAWGGIRVMGFKFGLVAPILMFLSHLVLPPSQVAT